MYLRMRILKYIVVCYKYLPEYEILKQQEIEYLFVSDMIL